MISQHRIGSVQESVRLNKKPHAGFRIEQNPPPFQTLRRRLRELVHESTTSRHIRRASGDVQPQ